MCSCIDTLLTVHVCITVAFNSFLALFKSNEIGYNDIEDKLKFMQRSHEIDDTLLSILRFIYYVFSAIVGALIIANILDS